MNLQSPVGRKTSSMFPPTVPKVVEFENTLPLVQVQYSFEKRIQGPPTLGFDGAAEESDPIANSNAAVNTCFIARC